MQQNFQNKDALYHGDYAVYFAGVHVPAASVNIRAGVWEYPQASITVPYSELLLRFGHDDRVPVAVFYKDLFWDKESGPKMRLLFDGEITGFSYALGRGQNSVYFQAISHLQIFAEMFIDYATSVEGIANAYAEIANTLKTADYRGILSYLLFKNGLDPGAPNVTRPIEIIRNLLQFLSSDGKDSDGNQVYLRNTAYAQFYNRHRKLVKLTKRFVAYPGIEDRLKANNAMFPIIEAIKADQTIQAVQGVMAAYSGKSSMWQFLYMIYSMMFYDLLVLNAPPFVQSDYSMRIVGKGNSELPRVTDDHLLLPVESTEDGATLKDSTRKVFVDEAYRSFDNSPFSDRSAVKNFNYPTYNGAVYDISYPTLAQCISKPSTVFALPPRCNVIFPSIVRSINYSENYSTQPTRLYLDDQEYLRTISAHTSNLSSLADALTRPGYPEEVNNAMLAQQGTERLDKANDVLLWPDEYFKGVIIHNAGSVPSWLRYLANHPDLGTAEDSEEVQKLMAELVPEDAAYKTFHTTDGTQITKQVIRLFSLYAKYQYFLEKYRNRSGSISMDFNPYIVCGLPFLYIDRPTKDSHLVGYINNVSWTLMPGSMTTDISFTMGRTIYECETELRKKFKQIDPNFATAYKGLITPEEPIWSLQPDLQQEELCADNYSQLFWPGESPLSTGAYQNYLVRLLGDGKTEALRTDGTLVPTTEFVLEVSDTYKACASNSTEAYAHIARPVCTIDEYIHFIDGIADDEKNSFDPNTSDKYLVIKEYTFLRMEDIDETAEDPSQTEVTITRCGAPDNVKADMRYDYMSLLLKYHNQVYNKKLST